MKMPMMRGSGMFNIIGTKLYDAVALPTVEGGSFIIALPKDKIELSMVEAEIVKSRHTLASFVEMLSNSTPGEDVTVMLPKLNIQITHEWSTPSSRV